MISHLAINTFLFAQQICNTKLRKYQGKDMENICKLINRVENIAAKGWIACYEQLRHHHAVHIKERINLF